MLLSIGIDNHARAKDNLDCADDVLLSLPYIKAGNLEVFHVDTRESIPCGKERISLRLKA